MSRKKSSCPGVVTRGECRRGSECMNREDQAVREKAPFESLESIQISGNDPNYGRGRRNVSERLSRETFAGLAQAEKRPSPLKAIRRHCVECMGGSFVEVERCTGFSCPLWEFRMGQRPHTTREKRPELLDVDAVKAQHPSLFSGGN